MFTLAVLMLVSLCIMIAFVSAHYAHHHLQILTDVRTVVPAGDWSEVNNMHTPLESLIQRAQSVRNYTTRATLASPKPVKALPNARAAERMIGSADPGCDVDRLMCDLEYSALDRTARYLPLGWVGAVDLSGNGYRTVLAAYSPDLSVGSVHPAETATRAALGAAEHKYRPLENGLGQPMSIGRHAHWAQSASYASALLKALDASPAL